jgi:hypothetical protein
VAQFRLRSPHFWHLKIAVGPVAAAKASISRPRPPLKTEAAAALFRKGERSAADAAVVGVLHPSKRVGTRRIWQTSYQKALSDVTVIT